MRDDYLMLGRGHPRSVMETVAALHRKGYGLIQIEGKFVNPDEYKLRTLKMWGPTALKPPQLFPGAAGSAPEPYLPARG